MTFVAILPEQSDTGVTYRAVAGERQSVGRTAGEALDALTNQIPDEDSGTLIVIQSHKPDRFFTDGQRRRLEELMNRWRTARDAGTEFAPRDQAELDALVEEELRAATDRAAALVQDISR